MEKPIGYYIYGLGRALIILAMLGLIIDFALNWNDRNPFLAVAIALLLFALNVSFYDSQSQYRTKKPVQDGKNKDYDIFHLYQGKWAIYDKRSKEWIKKDGKKDGYN